MCAVNSAAGGIWTPEEWFRRTAVLGQEYDGVICPVRFTGRVINVAELRYHIAEKEVIAILRVLENFRALVDSSPVITVYTRHSVLKWLLSSN
ncbi:Retrovirus-related Pol polyprotein from transposon opus [Phytophthora citrophthora]|uniref:Retrovirus-related Pol polyprotein from transposon opus n=1 Tax=Phytophthora citrophthora TaxID=4793 RepID=A0AAD9GLI8_9STRA|nr:Retrovirus-related Pol polyprotein from transposon opus [Phytophthora citrophthora]